MLFSAIFECTFFPEALYYSYFGHGGKVEDPMLLSGTKPHQEIHSP
jgi:hypothetical protein